MCINNFTYLYLHIRASTIIYLLKSRFQPGELVIIERKNKEPLEFTIASYRMHKGLHMLILA
jgi:hypothetical protein